MDCSRFQFDRHFETKCRNNRHFRPVYWNLDVNLVCLTEWSCFCAVKMHSQFGCHFSQGQLCCALALSASPAWLPPSWVPHWRILVATSQGSAAMTIWVAGFFSVFFPFVSRASNPFCHISPSIFKDSAWMHYFSDFSEVCIPMLSILKQRTQVRMARIDSFKIMIKPYLNYVPCPKCWYQPQPVGFSFEVVLIHDQLSFSPMVNYQLQPNHWLSNKPISLFGHISIFNYCIVSLCMVWRWSASARGGPNQSHLGPDLNQWVLNARGGGEYDISTLDTVVKNRTAWPRLEVGGSWCIFRTQASRIVFVSVFHCDRNQTQRKKPEVMETFRTSTTACWLVLAVTHQRPWCPCS